MFAHISDHKGQLLIKQWHVVVTEQEATEEQVGEGHSEAEARAKAWRWLIRFLSSTSTLSLSSGLHLVS